MLFTARKVTIFLQISNKIYEKTIIVPYIFFFIVSNVIFQVYLCFLKSKKSTLHRSKVLSNILSRVTMTNLSLCHFE